MLQKMGLASLEMVSGKDGGRKESCICCSVLGGYVQHALTGFLFEIAFHSLHVLQHVCL